MRHAKEFVVVVLLVICCFLGFWATMAVRQFYFTELVLADTAKESKATVIEARQRLIGTSQNLNAVLVQLGLAADNMRLASMKQKAVSDKTEKILDDFDALIIAANSSVSSLDDKAAAAMEAVPTTLAASQQTMQAATTALLSANALLTDRDLHETLGNMNTATRDFGVVAENMAVASTDIKEKVHGWLHPKWPEKIYSKFRDGLGIAAKVFF